MVNGLCENLAQPLVLFFPLFLPPFCLWLSASSPPPFPRHFCSKICFYDEKGGDGEGGHKQSTDMWESKFCSKQREREREEVGHT